VGHAHSERACASCTATLFAAFVGAAWLRVSTASATGWRDALERTHARSLIWSCLSHSHSYPWCNQRLNILFAHGRGREFPNTDLALMASNVVFNFALIPPLGAMGAAWLSLFARIANRLARIIFDKQSIG